MEKRREIKTLTHTTLNEMNNQTKTHTYRSNQKESKWASNLPESKKKNASKLIQPLLLDYY